MLAIYGNYFAGTRAPIKKCNPTYKGNEQVFAAGQVLSHNLGGGTVFPRYSNPLRAAYSTCTGCAICSETWIGLTWMMFPSCPSRIGQTVEPQNPSQPNPGLRADEILCKLVKRSKTFKADVGQSTMWFSNVLQLFAMKDDATFASIMKDIPCLLTIATSPDTAVSSKLMDLMTVQKVERKYLLIVTPTIDIELLQNKTTNFNIMLAYPGPGTVDRFGLQPGLGVKYF